MAVVIAAHGLGGAAAASANTDHGDRGAVHTEENVGVLDDDAKQAQEGSARRRARLFKLG